MTTSTKTCAHEFQGSSKCVRCGVRLRCACGQLVREDNFAAHLKTCEVAGRKTRRESLVSLRGRAGMSQEDLAEKAGITSITIYRLENGIGVPSLSTALRIAAALSAALGETVMVEDVME